MPGPRRDGDYPDRDLDCQFDLEASVINIIDAGRAMGWTTRDVTTALVALADNLMLADSANADLDAALDTARKRGWRL
jgi:hypothetical protein